MSDSERGRVPLGPLALLLLLPCLASAANQVSFMPLALPRGPWAGLAVAAVLALGVLLGGVGVLARRSRLGRRAGGPAEALVIGLSIGLGCAVIEGSHALDPYMPPHRLAWVEREDALRTVAAAREAGEPVIVDIEATWCAPYVRFEDDTPEHGRLRAEAARFVRVHVDASDDEVPVVREILRHFRVIGAPTILVLDGAGHEAARFDAYTPPEVLRAALEPVR